MMTSDDATHAPDIHSSGVICGAEEDLWRAVVSGDHLKMSIVRDRGSMMHTSTLRGRL
jgi:hypothetical protein